MGRQKLARGLARHGFTLTGGALAITLAGQTATASISASLVGATVHAATVVAAGHSAAGLISTQVLALSQGVMKTMLLQKLKLVSVLVLGVFLGSVGIGAIGVPGGGSEPGVQAAQAAQPSPAQQPGADNQEPLDGSLLLDPKIQQELRLSKNQVERLKAVSSEADQKNAPKRKEAEELQRKIQELRQQIAKIQASIGAHSKQTGKIQHAMEQARNQAVGQAAPQILSARAIQRVREIQRQRRGLRQLLEDARVQRMLKLDDEQMMRIEDIIKKQPVAWSGVYYEPRAHLSGLQYLSAIHQPALIAQGPNYYVLPPGMTLNMPFAVFQDQDKVIRQLLDTLTAEQKHLLRQWVGEPHSTGWKQVWEKQPKKRP